MHFLATPLAAALAGGALRGALPVPDAVQALAYGAQDALVRGAAEQGRLAAQQQQQQQEQEQDTEMAEAGESGGGIWQLLLSGAMQVSVRGTQASPHHPLVSSARSLPLAGRPPHTCRSSAWRPPCLLPC